MPLSIGQMAIHMIAALAAGAVIGTERSFHGRPAGFRTHALVAMASSMLMLVTLYQSQWLTVGESIRMDPTRMAQGIMTGIGFLGAGVIFKEGLTVRGLTTAASIWTTAAIGILMGAGLYLAGALATVLTLGILSVFRQLEIHFPAQVYAEAVLRFGRDAAMSEEAVGRLLAEHRFTMVRLSYQLHDGEQVLEYRMTIRTLAPADVAGLAQALRRNPTLRGFSVSPSSER